MRVASTEAACVDSLRVRSCHPAKIFADPSAASLYCAFDSGVDEFAIIERSVAAIDGFKRVEYLEGFEDSTGLGADCGDVLDGTS